MEQYEFTTPSNKKFTITSEEIATGWLTIVEVTNEHGEVFKYAWTSPYNQSYRDENADLRRIIEIVRDNY